MARPALPGGLLAGEGSRLGHLGHVPPDTLGHERSVSDTPSLPFTRRNARCQPFSLGWFFPDTEAVTNRQIGL